MKPVFWILLLLSLASGLSAWIGNDWGKQIGKRKLSLFALRPKHTSTFLTIVLSIALSFGLFGIYLALDGRTRDALLEPEKQLENQLAQEQTQQAQFTSVLQNLRRHFKRDQKPEIASLAAANSPQARSQAILKTAPPAVALTEHQSTAISQTQPKTPSILPARSQTKVLARIDAKQQLKPLVAAATQSPAQTTVAVRSLPQIETQVSLLKPEALQPEAKASTQPIKHSEVLAEPIFSLELSGNKSASESQQIIDGLVTLAQNYAQNMGIQSSERIQLDPQNIQSIQMALEKSLYYQLNVQAAPVQNEQYALPIRLTLQPQKQDLDFDPHQILEQNRLAPPQDNRPLQHDLQASIQALAQANQEKLILNAPQKSSAATQLAELPFYILNLHRAGPTLKGQLVFSQSALP